MKHSMIYHLIPMFVISLFFVGVGLMVLIRKKPVILNYKWMLLLIAIMFLQPSLSSFEYSSDITDYMFLAFIVVMLGYFYYIMKGVIVIGADGDEFQKAFIAILNESNNKPRDYEK